MARRNYNEDPPFPRIGAYEPEVVHDQEPWMDALHPSRREMTRTKAIAGAIWIAAFLAVLACVLLGIGT